MEIVLARLAGMLLSPPQENRAQHSASYFFNCSIFLFTDASISTVSCLENTTFHYPYAAQPIYPIYPKPLSRRILSQPKTFSSSTTPACVLTVALHRLAPNFPPRTDHCSQLLYKTGIYSVLQVYILRILLSVHGPSMAWSVKILRQTLSSTIRRPRLVEEGSSIIIQPTIQLISPPEAIFGWPGPSGGFCANPARLTRLRFRDVVVTHGDAMPRSPTKTPQSACAFPSSNISSI